MRDPGKLYKYRSLAAPARPWVERIFSHSELYYASPDEINDPLEFRFKLSFEATESERRMWAVRTIQRQFGLSAGEASREAIALFQRLDQQPPSPWQSAAESELQENIRRRVAVMSLSEVNDDILMWSHYADSHRGICIEFTASKSTPFFAETVPVEYSDNIPVLSHYRDTQYEVFRASCLVKAAHWSYEREWRSVEVRAGRGAKRFPIEHLTAVILGACISAEHESEVRGWVGRFAPHARIERASLSPGRFGLEIARAPTPGAA